MNEAISVIMPAFNSQDYIVRAVKSVLSQTYQNFELIIISDDLFDYKQFLESKGIINKRIKYFNTGKYKTSPSFARNICLSLVKNNIVAVLDSDDTFIPEKLQLLLPKVIDYGVATCALNYRKPDETLITTIGDDANQNILTADTFPFVNFGGNSMIVLDIEKIPIKFCEIYPVMEDLVFVMSCFDYVEEIYHHSKPLHNYYFSSTSLSNNQNTNNLFIDTKKEMIKQIDLSLFPVKNAIAQKSTKQFLEISIDCETKFSKLKQKNKEAAFIPFLKETLKSYVS